MNNNEVDKFLLAHKTEIADDGFSDEVMRRLPARQTNHVAVERIWAIVCLVVTLFVCSQLSWSEDLLIDVKAFLTTLPLESAAKQWFYVLGIPILTIWASTAILTRFTIIKLTQK